MSIYDDAFWQRLISHAGPHFESAANCLIRGHDHVKFSRCMFNGVPMIAVLDIVGEDEDVTSCVLIALLPPPNDLPGLTAPVVIKVPEDEPHITVNIEWKERVN